MKFNYCIWLTCDKKIYHLDKYKTMEYNDHQDTQKLIIINN